MTLPMASGLPSNYMTQQYWQYLAELMQQQQQMRQTQMQNIYAAQAQSQNQSAANLTTASNIPNAQMNAVPPSMANQVGDGKDDGVISFGAKMKNMGKGVVNFFKGMVCDDKGNFSLKRTLTTAAVAVGAVALTVATGGAAAPFLVAAGAAIGGVQVAKGAYNAATAKTDAEAEAAWQNIGSGATAVVGSFVGAKGAVKSAGGVIPKGNMVTSSIRATGQCFKTSYEGGLAGMRALKSPTTAWTNVKGYYSDTVKPNMIEAFAPKNAGTNYTNRIASKNAKGLEEYNQKVAKLNEELIKPETTPERRIAINEEMVKLTNENQAVIQTASSVTKGTQRQLIEETITNIEKELANPATTPAQKTLLTQVREQAYESLINLEKPFTRAEYAKFIKEMKTQKETLEANVKNAADAAGKKTAQAELDNFNRLAEIQNKTAEINFRSDKIAKAQDYINQYKQDLKKAGIADADKTALQKQISKMEAIIKQENKALFKINANIAAKTHLPQVGVAYGNYYLAGTPAQVDTPSADQLLNQGYTEEQYAQLMAQLQNPGPNELAALNGAGGYPQPQMNFSNSLYNTMPPTGSPLGFEDLYQSPYPQMF